MKSHFLLIGTIILFFIVLIIDIFNLILIPDKMYTIVQLVYAMGVNSLFYLLIILPREAECERILQERNTLQEILLKRERISTTKLKKALDNIDDKSKKQKKRRKK